MKVIQINSVYGQGSTGRIVADLRHMLESSGNECTAIYGRGKASSDNHTVRVETNVGVATHVLRSRITDRQGFYSRPATNRLNELVRENNADLIHLHNIHGYYLHLDTLFRELVQLDRPVVWTLHDCWPFTGHCVYFDAVECDRWLTGCGRCPQQRDYPASWVLDRSAKNYIEKRAIFTGLPRLHLVTPSTWLRNLVHRSFLGDLPISIIPNGIDLTKFQPRESNLREAFDIGTRTVILGVASNWGKRKGLSDFMHLAGELNDSYRIVLIGLDRRATRGLPSNIVAIPKTDSVKELAEWYSCADLFLNMSYDDNFPTTIVEALACGTPVMTYDTGGCGESLSSDNGTLVNTGDVCEVVRRVKAGDWRKNRSSCRESARSFDRNLMMQRYEQLYRDLSQKA